MFWKSLIPAIINPISLFFLWRTDVLFVQLYFAGYYTYLVHFVLLIIIRSLFNYSNEFS